MNVKDRKVESNGWNLILYSCTVTKWRETGNSRDEICLPYLSSRVDFNNTAPKSHRSIRGFRTLSIRCLIIFFKKLLNQQHDESISLGSHMLSTSAKQPITQIVRSRKTYRVFLVLAFHVVLRRRPTHVSLLDGRRNDDARFSIPLLLNLIATAYNWVNDIAFSTTLLRFPAELGLLSSPSCWDCTLGSPIALFTGCRDSFFRRKTAGWWSWPLTHT
jgi:hypothetical protein